MTAEDVSTKLANLLVETRKHIVAVEQERQARAALSDEPVMGAKCRSCLKRTKVPWYRTALHYVKSLWVYWRLPARDRERVREWMKHPDRAPRVPNKLERYRFWCFQCKKLVKDKNVSVISHLGYDLVYDRVSFLDMNNRGAREESDLGLGFRVRCHGDTLDYTTTLVAAYVERPCHIVLFGERAKAPAWHWFD